MATGLTLNLQLPRGEAESISAQSHDLGLRIISLMLPLKEMYSLPEDLQIFRPDGEQLLLHQTLQAQGLRNGSTLSIKDNSRKGAKKSWEGEKIVVGPEDFVQDDGTPSYEDNLLLCPREERDAQALYLKEKANDYLKGENFTEAAQLYTAALAWLPPEDSDHELAAAVFGNRALAHLKLKDWRGARDDAERSLLLRPDSAKVRYRLGVAERELGDLETARLEFQGVLRRDPNDRTTRAALASVEAELKAAQAKEVELPVLEVPPAIKWRLEKLQQGYALPRFANVWQRVERAGSQGTIDASCVAALRHILRSQPPVERFFREGLSALAEAEPAGVAVMLLGAGSCSAARACSSLLERGRICRATMVEPCSLLVEHCRQICSGMRILHSPGQIDNEFAIPSAAFQLRGPPSAEVEGAVAREAEEEASSLLSHRAVLQPLPTLALVCDRLSDDLVGERLLTTVAGGLEATRRHLPPGAKVVCVPSRAALCCAPVELRCDEAAGSDVSKVNALRFSAHDAPEEQLAPGAKTGPSQRESYGWWPMDLDEEVGQPGFCCRACSAEKVVWAYDLADADTFSLQQRQLTRTLEINTIMSGRMNAMAVWWRLEGPGGTTLTSQPEWSRRLADAWPGKRQAVFYSGFEMGIEQGEKLTFKVNLKDGLSRLKFELVSPKLTERMGLVKFEVKLTSMQAVRELREKLDLRTNRLMSAVTGTVLERRDKLIQFGPFELPPGTFDSKVWDKVEDRLRLHVNRPLKGDAPVTCVFRHGAFEGTVRWPVPCMGDDANVPRLPNYFEGLRECCYKPYTSALVSALQGVGAPNPRVLEIGCGPVPLLAMCAARHGARAWAVEMVPELRELAHEAVRENGLEMIFKYKGYSSYSFFGEPRKPEDPSVRVMKALPSTSLRVGLTPKLLDGARAHIVACSPDGGPLGEDYLETMWHAAEQLLEPNGALLPSSLVVWAAPVQWLPFGSLETSGLLHSRLCAGRTEQALASDRLLPLCASATEVLRIDLARRSWPLPSAAGSVQAEEEGVLTGVAFWHEADFGVDGESRQRGPFAVCPDATVCFLRSPRKVSCGEVVRFGLRFVDHQLQLSVYEG